MWVGCVFTVPVVSPGLEARKIPRTQHPLTAACSVVAAFTSTSVGCLSVQLSGGFASNRQVSANECCYKSHMTESMFLKECVALFYRTGDLWAPKTSEIIAPNVLTLTSKRVSLGGLTGGGVFFVLVCVQEWRVSCEGAHSKALLRCEPPAQRPTD